MRGSKCLLLLLFCVVVMTGQGKALIKESVSIKYPEVVGLLQAYQPDDDVLKKILEGDIFERVSFIEEAQKETLTSAYKNNDQIARLSASILARYGALHYVVLLDNADQKHYEEALKKVSEEDFDLFKTYQKKHACAPENLELVNIFAQHFAQKYKVADQKDIDQAMDRVLPMLDFAAPTYCLMTHGGDDRLHLCPKTKKNKYHTSSMPYIDGIARSSCTSSAPTLASFTKAEQVRQTLLKHSCFGDGQESFVHCMRNVRKRITKALLPKDSGINPYVVMMPSGSDAEMIFTLLALSGHPQWTSSLASVAKLDKPLVSNIVVAAGEVGSGTADASGMRHFSDYVPYGPMVTKQATIDGVPQNAVTVIECSTRDKKTGNVVAKDQLEKQIEGHLLQAIEQQGQCAVLHMVHCSKTGVGTPRVAFLESMKQRYKNKLVVVIDAAQGRFADGVVADYLKRKFCVLLTGSKFFAGAPFSGVVLLPEQEAAQWERENFYVPQGLGNYSSAYECDERLLSLQKGLPHVQNGGLLLRWESALHEVESFYVHAADLRQSLAQQWTEGVCRLVERYAPELDLFVHDEQAEQNSVLGKCNTVVSFTLAVDNKRLDVAVLRKIHGLMSQDVSHKLPANATQHERTVAQRKCFIGQPVGITSGNDAYGVLRVALSAPMVAKMARDVDAGVSIDAAVQQMLAEDQKIFEKMSLIVRYLDHLAS